MPIDPEYLRQHYASLSDEGLRAINRADLVEIAQQCYDYELSQREQSSRLGFAKAGGPPAASKLPQTADEKVEIRGKAPEAIDKPEWLDDGIEIFSRTDWGGTTPAADIVNARDALEAAGIPCYLDLSEMPEETSVSPQ